MAFYTRKNNGDGGGGGGAGTHTASQVMVATQVGNNVTLDLSTLPNVFVDVLGISRGGQVITPIDDWSVTGETLTIYNADTSTAFIILYTY